MFISYRHTQEGKEVYKSKGKRKAKAKTAQEKHQNNWPKTKQSGVLTRSEKQIYIT